MLDREKIVAVLKKRFPGSPSGQVAAAANAIIGLDDEWEDVSLPALDWDDDRQRPCRDGCHLRRVAAGGASLKIFRRRSA
jgi:hypothetical protein